MKRLCAVLAVAVALSLAACGCEDAAHRHYRQANLRRVVDADVIGVADDFEAGWLVSDRPAHLTWWYPR
jgi:hypothetical protein